MPLEAADVVVKVAGVVAEETVAIAATLAEAAVAEAVIGLIRLPGRPNHSRPLWRKAWTPQNLRLLRQPARHPRAKPRSKPVLPALLTAL